MDRRNPTADEDLLSLSDFRRVVLRVGTIVAAEPMPGSTRLLAVTVDLGSEQRHVVAGLAQAYTPGQLHGLQVVVAANLAPAVIRGAGSHGMLLGVGCGDPGAVALLTVNRPVPNGAAVT
jgi:methionyl-tRNA synthetase